MGSFYRIAESSTTVMSCFDGNQAQIVEKVSHSNPGYIHQSWQFIAVLGSASTYYIRNAANVYLQASDDTVFAADSEEASQWVLVPQSPILGKIPYKIKASGTDLWMQITDDAVDLGSDTNAVVWDIQMQDNYPLDPR
ncbi:MAG: hypothetical protein IPM69_15155 [Ignavibacteria bacterium]|nr:hypothetical protein [Ignavibacteria bacterium]